MTAMKYQYSPKDIPKSFDSRTKWPGKIQVDVHLLVLLEHAYANDEVIMVHFNPPQGVRDQGWCGASWAFSTTAVAADRYYYSKCLKSVWEVVRLGALRFTIEGESAAESMSAQALISCNTEGQSGCRGGFVDRAWNFLRRFG